jgi:hypothetical protein
MNGMGNPGSALSQKLGIRPWGKVSLVDPPDGFSLLLPDDAAFVGASIPNVDVIVWFVLAKSTLDRRFDQTLARLGANGTLWIVWPKKGAGVPTDVADEVVREVATAKGRLVDQRIVPFDNTWNGVRVVGRLPGK